jgi:hypothetical protein
VDNIVLIIGILFTIYFFWSVIKVQFYSRLQERMDRLDGLDPEIENKRLEFERELGRRRNLRNRQKQEDSKNE